MITLITLFTTVVVGFTPFVMNTTDTISEKTVNAELTLTPDTNWDYDIEKGWIYRLPEINILAGGKSRTVEAEGWTFDAEHGWMYELMSINVTAVNS